MKYRVRSSIFAFLLALATAASAAPSGFPTQDSRPRHYGNRQSAAGGTVPENTIISVRMNTGLSSKHTRVGDKFTATVVRPVHVNGQMAIPSGSMIEGRITQVTPAKRMSRPGTIAVDFDQLVLPDGRTTRINGSLTSDDPYTRRQIDDESRITGEKGRNPIVFIGSGGAMGAVLGAITGGLKGAAVGGAIGAGVGMAKILWARGEEAEVPAGTPFGVQLRQAMHVPADPGGSVASDPSGGRDQDPGYRDSSRRDPSDRDPSYRDPSYRDPAPRDSAPRDSAPRDNSDPDPGPVARDSNRPETSTPIGRSSSADREPTQPSTPVNEEPAAPEPEPEPEPVSLSSAEGVRRAQTALKEQGYYEGQIDGEMTPRTSAALKTYQREHKLPETGQLDEATARSLGIIGRSAQPKSTTRRDPGPAASREPSSRRAESPAGADPARGVVPANVLGASALRQSDGSIYISIDTQANTGGWRWYGEHAVNGDTLEVFAKAVPPTGIATQVVTRGRIELKLMDRVERVRRVVVHSSGADRTITLDGAPAPAANEPAPSNAVSPDAAQNLQRQAEALFAEYQRICGVRMTSGNVEVGRNSDPEIELLFALDGFVKSSQLYSRLLPSLRDNARRREATLSLAKQGRLTDRVVATSSARCAKQLLPAWDEIRQLVLELMGAYGITADDIEP